MEDKHIAPKMHSAKINQFLLLIQALQWTGNRIKIITQKISLEEKIVTKMVNLEVKMMLLAMVDLKASNLWEDTNNQLD